MAHLIEIGEYIINPAKINFVELSGEYIKFVMSNGIAGMFHRDSADAKQFLLCIRQHVGGN